MVTLLHRTVVDQLRDKEFKAKCIQHLITAIIIGIIFLRTPWNETKSPYYQSDVFNINGAITILVVFFSFAFVYLVIYKFPQMKKLLRRYLPSSVQSQFRPKEKQGYRHENIFQRALQWSLSNLCNLFS